MEQKKLLSMIQQVGFYLVELNLYLDTHPDCQEALERLNYLSEKLTALRKEYCCNFGPLTNYGLQPAECWDQWVSEPWPWEREAN
ncbi:spore coat protein CotJB [Clostridium zeae]|uniref:Spore coat protein CotJB n=1 Tax=Clostridium zeae TaxID=2759022 RepID=A0ABQ1EC07_9CLOT|nr:spore coat protein CotJB [Clostridium zeae]GFZ32028.1 spore coat protein CotJB [Clostridium zeae]